MTKSPKELAFLRDLYVDAEWTAKFTELADKHFGFTDDRSLLYRNAGTGNHVLAIAAKAHRDARITATCENEHLLKIAADKAIATKSIVDFTGSEPEPDSFDAVIADASLVRPYDLADFAARTASFAETGGTVALMTFAAGSFGEIFSLLWEAMMDDETADLTLAERLITELPTTSRFEEILEASELESVETKLANTTFDFENGTAFVSSPLIADFLMPMWFDGMTEKQFERVRDRLAQLIDAESEGLPFRFSVKTVLAIGEKR